MVTEYTSKKSAHAHSEMKNVKNVTVNVMGTKYAPKKVKVDGVYFWIFNFDISNNTSTLQRVHTEVLLHIDIIRQQHIDHDDHDC